jgi:SAM-dependent methyltransferase
MYGESPSRVLERVHRQWTTLGENDPLWAILTRPGKESGRWDVRDFFETGSQEIEDTLRIAASRVGPVEFGQAVDFGCGVGRLTQALASHFDRVVGIDVSQPMIEAAIRLNAFPETCEYRQNVASDLSLLRSGMADLVYSNITLQHMPPALSRRYIREFFRVVRSGGQVVFQLPTRPRSVLRFRLKRMLPTALTNFLWRWRSGSAEAMESYFISERDVRALVAESGGEVILALPDREGPPGWESRKYFCLRKTAVSE